MTSDIEHIRPRNDNVLVQFDVHAPHEEQVTPGGIIIPETAADAELDQGGILATVVAAGPGVYADAWVDHETGTAPVGSRVFVPVDPEIQPGVRVVLARAALGADRVWSDEVREFRMVKAHVIEGVVEE